MNIDNFLYYLTCDNLKDLIDAIKFDRTIKFGSCPGVWFRSHYIRLTFKTKKELKKHLKTNPHYKWIEKTDEGYILCKHGH